MENIENKVTELKIKEAELPKGYISRKMINGKIKFYLQWQENGKKKSKYIPEKDLPEIENKIEERKKIQAELKKLNAEMPSKIKTAETFSFNTDVKTGNALLRYTDAVKKLLKRDCFIRLHEYLYNDVYGKVFILYGLRRTGKTTMIRQAIAEMSDTAIEKTAFIQIGQEDTFAKLKTDLNYLEEKGYKYVFIDEVTQMSDFVDGAALLSDIYASMGMKIVLSGTDSLGFMFAEDDQLYDRCIMLHTTFIPYHEFEKVLGIKGIDEYIRFGGTMSLSGINYNSDSPFADGKSVNEYVDSAIARNIQHSLKCYQHEGHFRHLTDLYEKNELTSAINRVIEDMNHRFTIEVLTKDFISNDLSLSATNLRKDSKNKNDILDRIDKEKVTNRLKEMPDIKNKDEQSIDIQDYHRTEIKEYLEILDLIKNIEIQTIPVVNKKEYRTVFTQPGMRYCIAESLIKSLLMDEMFQSISAVERKYVLSRILSEIKGRMMEDIILLETKMAKKGKNVFKLQFAIGEFDMAVSDDKDVSCEIYEIKHSDQITKEQYKNLINEEKCFQTEFRYGKILNKYVIYRGESKKLDNGIIYLNVEEYLKRIYEK